MSPVRFPSCLGWIATLFFVVGGAACGGEGDGEDPTAKATIVSFSQDRSPIVEGETVTLSWITKNAKAVSLVANGFVVNAGVLASSGELEIKPSANTTYRLDAVGRDGSITSKETDVEVQAYGAPSIDSFEASKAEVAKGEAIDLSWTATHASSISIHEKNGRSVSTGAVDPLQGSIEVLPTRSTIYVLRAGNEHGTATAEVQVTVAQQPSLRFSSSLDVVPIGEEATLEWTAEGAVTVSIHDPVGALLHEGKGESGSLVIQPATPGTYTATARGLGGEESASVVLALLPVIDLFTAKTHGEIRAGTEAEVQWDVRGAEELTLMNYGGSTLTLPGPTGSQMVSLGTGGGFVLVARRGNVSAEAKTAVEVTERPIFRSVTTSDVVTAGNGHRGDATIFWEIDGAAKLRIDVIPGGLVDLTDKNPRLGEKTITFTGRGTITLTASNSSGESVLVIPSPVDPVPTIAELFAAPSRVGAGETTSIHWQTLDAASMILKKDEVSMGVDPTLVNGSRATGPLMASSSYVLHAFNRAGFEVVSEPLLVEVGAPRVLSLYTADKKTRVAINSTVTLEWENDGGTSLVVKDQGSGATLCTSSDPLEIRKGSCDVVMPATEQVKTYSLTVTNGSGADTQSIDISAVTGSMIESFITDRPSITEGETVLFSWIITTDWAGNSPVLELKDQHGTDYPLAGADPLAGSARFRIPTFGHYTFTLSATSPGSTPAEETFELEVYGIPIVGGLTAAPTFAAEQRDPILLSWTSTHGASLEIFQLDRQGNVVGNRVHATNVKALVDAGSATVNPTIEAPSFRVIVKNPLGIAREADFRIGVNPATIVQFDASDVDLLAGEELTLEWEVVRATGANLNVNGWANAEFLDLRQRPTSTLANWSTDDDVGVVITFPSNFQFPLYGQSFSSIEVNDNGWASFDIGASSGLSFGNVGFPATGNNQKAHISPFWDDLHLNRSSPKGTMRWEIIEMGAGRALVIQWVNINFWSTSLLPSDLNFQAILHESGDIEYRYGDMISSDVGMSNGSSATIGMQGWGGSPFKQISLNAAVPGGLTGKGYFYYLSGTPPADPLPHSGTWSFFPSADRTYVLQAWNGHSEDERAIDIRVHRRGTLTATANPPSPAVGTPVSLHWTGANLTSLTIEDPSGAAIHSVTGSQTASGSHGLGVLPQGSHTYTLRGEGQIPRDQVVETVVITVN